VTKHSKKDYKNIKSSFEHIGKLISVSIIVILLFVGGFLIYYFISAKVVAKNSDYIPKFSLYTIISGSMEPAIKVYDLIFDVRVDDFSKIKKGDVITFHSRSPISFEKTVTHRVVDVKIVNDKYEFVTKGDDNPTADSATVREEDVIGKTLFRLPQFGRIQIFLTSKIGWIMFILIPALGIVIYDVIKLLNIFNVSDSAKGIKADLSSEEKALNEENKRIKETIEQIKKRHKVN